MLEAGCLILSLEVPRDVLVQRLSGRRMDPSTRRIYHVDFAMPHEPEVAARLVRRPDDMPEAIGRRIDTFEAQREAAVAPLLAAGLRVERVDADAAPDEVFRRVMTRVWAAGP